MVGRLSIVNCIENYQSILKRIDILGLNDSSIGADVYDVYLRRKTLTLTSVFSFNYFL